MANIFSKLIKRPSADATSNNKPQITVIDNRDGKYGGWKYADGAKILILSNVDDNFLQNIKGFDDVNELRICNSKITKLPQIKNIGKNISNIKFYEVEGLSKCDFLKFDFAGALMFDNCKKINNLEFNADVYKLTFKDCDVTNLDLSNCPRKYVKFQYCKGFETIDFHKCINQLNIEGWLIDGKKIFNALPPFDLCHLEGALSITGYKDVHNLKVSDTLTYLEIRNCNLESDSRLNLTNTRCDVEIEETRGLNLIRFGENKNVLVKGCDLHSSGFNFNNVENIKFLRCCGFDSINLTPSIHQLTLEDCYIEHYTNLENFTGEIIDINCNYETSNISEIIREYKEAYNNKLLYNENSQEDISQSLTHISQNQEQEVDVENIEANIDDIDIDNEELDDDDMCY